MPDLVTPEEGMSPVPDHSNNAGYETQGSAPADVNANQDNFQDKDRQETLAQALEKEFHKAPWQKQLTLGPIDDLKKMTKTVKPIYEGFWYNSDQNILARLDQVARKLKEKRAAQFQDSQEDDTDVSVTPNLEKNHSLSNEPIGHHVLQCSKETAGHPEGGHSQHSSWTLDGPSKDCPPISWCWLTNLAAPSPRNSGQLLSKAKFNCQDAHRPPTQGSPDVDCPDHPAQGHAEKNVTRRNQEPHQLRLKQEPLPCLKYHRDIQVCSALVTLFTWRHAYLRT